LLFSRRETYQFVHVAVVKLIAYVLSHGTGNDFEYVVGRVEREKLPGWCSDSVRGHPVAWKGDQSA
jgi:hypothetical protein